MTPSLEETARAAIDPLLTVADLEQILRVDRRTIARLCKSGKIPPPIKVGGSNRWRLCEIKKMIQKL